MDNRADLFSAHSLYYAVFFVERESDKYNMMATASYMATIALCDALLVALMEETDYKKEQFAPIHPGGAVGRMLNHPDGLSGT